METKYTYAGAINNKEATALYVEITDAQEVTVDDIDTITQMGSNVFVEIKSRDMDADYDEFTKIISLDNKELAGNLQTTLIDARVTYSDSCDSDIDNFIPLSARVMDAIKVDELPTLDTTHIDMVHCEGAVLMVTPVGGDKVAYSYNSGDEAVAAATEINANAKESIEFMRHGVGAHYLGREIIVHEDRGCYSVENGKTVRSLGRIMDLGRIEIAGSVVTSECFTVDFIDEDVAVAFHARLMDVLG